MTPAQFTRLGEKLYGPMWKTDLAESLGIALRTVHRFAAGQREIHEGITLALADLCEKRGGELINEGKRLRATIG